MSQPFEVKFTFAILLVCDLQNNNDCCNMIINLCLSTSLIIFFTFAIDSAIDDTNISNKILPSNEIQIENNYTTSVHEKKKVLSFLICVAY